MRRNGPVAIPSNSATVVSSLSLETTGQSEPDIRTKRDAALTSFTSNVEAEQRSFETDVKEQEALQVGCRTQEAWRANGQQNANCEEVTCLRGLVALFENREDAIHAFQELRTTAPNGRSAASSTRWFTLLAGIRQAQGAVHAIETGDPPWPAGSGHPCRKSEIQRGGTANRRGEPLNAGISTACRKTETK